MQTITEIATQVIYRRMATGFGSPGAPTGAQHYGAAMAAAPQDTWRRVDIALILCTEPTRSQSHPPPQSPQLWRQREVGPRHRAGVARRERGAPVRPHLRRSVPFRSGRTTPHPLSAACAVPVRSTSTAPNAAAINSGVGSGAAGARMVSDI